MKRLFMLVAAAIATITFLVNTANAQSWRRNEFTWHQNWRLHGVGVFGMAFWGADNTQYAVGFSASNKAEARKEWPMNLKKGKDGLEKINSPVIVYEDPVGGYFVALICSVRLDIANSIFNQVTKAWL